MKKELKPKKSFFAWKFRCSFGEQGFTLIELLIVIAVIGILAGVVMVNSSGGVEKAKKASAITTASSILPELVTCQDDGGFAKSSAPAAENYVCCSSATTCGTAFSGHTVTWPDVNTKTGWAYGSVSGSLANGDYSYTLTKTGQTTITCNYATNDCN